MIFISSKASDGNMEFNSDDPKEVLKNREQFLKSLGINLKAVAEVKQVHGNKVLCVNTKPNPTIQADGLITNNAALYLMLKVADCIPVGLYDPKHNAIGLIHAGWRGLEKGIIKSAIQKMIKNFGSKPQDLIVKFGPSIGPCCYRMDIWKEAEKQLTNCGVLKENIDNPKICTYENKGYFSHRRSQDQNVPDYRFVTILGIGI